MINFPEHQKRAKRLTLHLWLLWGFSLLLLVGLTCVIIGVSTQYGMSLYDVQQPRVQPWTPEVTILEQFWAWIERSWLIALVAGAVILGVVAISSAITWFGFRSGGATVARALGGRELTEKSKMDIHEQRAFAVVNEMSIAAGTPRPRVFILPDESINAFAAGHDPSDAAIGLTQGAITHLSREELQGVVAHEFSHIVHGDMRLNLTLTTLISGLSIVFVIGRLILHLIEPLSSSRTKGTAGSAGLGIAIIIATLGLGLMALGAIGQGFSRLIQAAISRQREYLADASAVQFTRNPKGIAGALAKIDAYGSRLSHPRSSQFSHMFFGQSQRKSLWMATHPPIADRLARLGFSRRKESKAKAAAE